MSRPRLEALVRASDALAAESGRNAKVEIIVQALREAADDVDLAALYLSGGTRQDRLDVGWAAIRDTRVAPAATSSLTLRDVDVALQQLADAGGAGSRGARLAVLTDLLAAATDREQRFIRHLIGGEMHHGASEGLVLKGLAAAFDVKEAQVRRARMLSGSLPETAVTARDEGADGLARVGLVVGRGVLPMLASTAPSVADAVADMGRALVDWKLDGARIQAHRQGDDVRVYTRNLNDITARSADVVAAVRALPVSSVILDGEVLAVDEDGLPWAFQDTMSAFSREQEDAGAPRPRLSAFWFDVLHVDGEDLIDQPLTARRERLVALVPDASLIPGEVVDDPAAGQRIEAEALDRGHEGVMVKALDAPYAAGRRGKAWRKVKPVRTLDLVVIGVEWGSGRRSGWLSNIHLAARDDRPGRDGFVMLGKTFKGMTDAMLEWQTRRFTELAISDPVEGEVIGGRRVVRVRPEQVVEIALDGIQTSRRYPGGVALRFARVLRYRDDKSPDEVDALSTVLALRTRS